MSCINSGASNGSSLFFPRCDPTTNGRHHWLHQSISLLSILSQTDVFPLSHSTETCGCGACLRVMRCGAERFQGPEGVYFITNHWAVLQERGCYCMAWQKLLLLLHHGCWKLFKRKPEEKGASRKSWMGQPNVLSREATWWRKGIFSETGPCRFFWQSLLAIQGLLCSHKLDEETAPGTRRMMEPAVEAGACRHGSCITDHLDGVWM